MRALHGGFVDWDIAVHQIRTGSKPLPADPRTHRSERRGLFDTYIRDLSPIVVDVQRRPDHYTKQEKETLEKLRRKEDVPERDKTALLLAFNRNTAVAKATKEIVTKAMTKSVDSAEEGGEAVAADGSFEGQDFGPTIKII